MKKLMMGFKYACKGIYAAVVDQPNMRIHMVIASLVIMLGFYLNVSQPEWYFLIFGIGAVITAELFNSSLEGLVNLVEPRHQPLAGKVKDIAAGAVLVSAMAATLVGIMVFSKHMFP